MKNCEHCGHPLNRWAASCFQCEDAKRAELLRSKSAADSVKFGIVKFGEKRLSFEERTLQQCVDALVEVAAKVQDPEARSAMTEALALLLKYAGDRLDYPVGGVHEERFFMGGRVPQGPQEWH